jgi:hypothetical protein
LINELCNQPFKDDFITVERELGYGVILLLWFLSIRTYLYVIIWDLQYNCGGYMALALVVQETFSSLLAVTLIG